MKNMKCRMTALALAFALIFTAAAGVPASAKETQDPAAKTAFLQEEAETTATLHLSMAYWLEYADRAGIQIDGVHTPDTIDQEEALTDFACASLAPQYIESWILEGADVQIIGYHFTDSESARTILSSAEEICREEGKRTTGTMEEEGCTLVAMAPRRPGRNQNLYTDLLQYAGNFIYIETYGADGAANMDRLLDEVFAGYTAQPEETGSAWYDDMVDDAIDVMLDAWKDTYYEPDYPDKEYLLKILNTRIICIEDSLEGTQQQYFGDVAYIIEFMLLDDYMSQKEVGGGQNAGYYTYSGVNDNVTVFKDGRMECQSRALTRYRALTYDIDFGTLIEDIVDLDDAYNQVFRFKGHEVVE